MWKNFTASEVEAEVVRDERHARRQPDRRAQPLVRVPRVLRGAPHPAGAAEHPRVRTGDRAAGDRHRRRPARTGPVHGLLRPTTPRSRRTRPSRRCGSCSRTATARRRSPAHRSATTELTLRVLAAAADRRHRVVLPTRPEAVARRRPRSPTATARRRPSTSTTRRPSPRTDFNGSSSDIWAALPAYDWRPLPIGKALAFDSPPLATTTRHGRTGQRRSLAAFD